MYTIKPIETDKHKIPQRQAAKKGIIPRFPFSWMMSGSSGSGKTCLAMNVLTRKELYGNFFHCILVFSPTAGKYDDTYDCLKLPKENFLEDFGEEMLDKIIEARKAKIKKKGITWVAKNERMLIIMDDVIANRQFLESAGALKMFSLLRHYLVSVMILIQSYTKLPRALRLNCNAVSVFPALRSEIETLKEEICPNQLVKKEFEEVLKYCMEGRYDFLYINRHAEPNEQLRKNLDEIINLETFKLPTKGKTSNKNIKEDKTVVNKKQQKSKNVEDRSDLQDSEQ